MATEAQKSMMQLGNEFYALMGNCVGIWASVEEYLFKIFRSALGATTKRSAIVYYRSPTIDTRRSVTDELVRTVLPTRDPPNGGKEHPDTQQWIDLNKEIGELLRVRNRIAHQPMGPRHEFGSEEGTSTLWFEIYISDHEQIRKDHPIPPLRKEDLEKHVGDVWRLKEALATFRQRTLSKYVRLLP